MISLLFEHFNYRFVNYTTFDCFNNILKQCLTVNKRQAAGLIMLYLNECLAIGLFIENKKKK